MEHCGCGCMSQKKVAEGEPVKSQTKQVEAEPRKRQAEEDKKEQK